MTLREIARAAMRQAQKPLTEKQQDAIRHALALGIRLVEIDGKQFWTYKGEKKAS